MRADRGGEARARRALDELDRRGAVGADLEARARLARLVLAVRRLVIERLRAANVLLLEANHDIKMLQDCPYRPWSLKQRILSRHGHLSNEAAADATEQFMSAELTRLYLGHLSRECNRAELAQGVMAERLRKIGATHVRLEVAAQNAPSPTLRMPEPTETISGMVE